MLQSTCFHLFSKANGFGIYAVALVWQKMTKTFARYVWPLYIALILMAQGLFPGVWQRPRPFAPSARAGPIAGSKPGRSRGPSAWKN